MSLEVFSPRTRDWFTGAFAGPTPAQEQAWPAIASGEHVLISAPTGSGKTLAAFLYGIDQLAGQAPEPAAKDRRIRLVYISPLKALSYDIDRNLRTPIRGIGADLQVAVRTGDTPQKERAQMLRSAPDILITTPESLYLMLTGRAQNLFSDTRWCIIDEIHAVASTKRGSHPRSSASVRPPSMRSSGSACRPPRIHWRRSGASWSAPGGRAASSTPG
jgi:ATP-dependent Lhr-like helicase